MALSNFDKEVLDVALIIESMASMRSKVRVEMNISQDILDNALEYTKGIKDLNRVKWTSYMTMDKVILKNF